MTELRHERSVPAVPAGLPVLAALGELEVAHEELRVAEEELAEQREQIERLVARHDEGLRWRDRLFAVLPVGVLVTDGGGKILEANTSAAALLGVGSLRLPGKPLPVYVDPADRRLVRDLIAQLAHGHGQLRAAVTLVPREGETVHADLVVVTDEEAAAGTLRWIVLPRVAASPPTAAAVPAPDSEGSVDPLRTATALAQLATLPVEDDDQQRLLSRIALVVGAAVPGASTVSVAIGDPVAPDRVASDSAAAQSFDRLQMETGEGPCVDAFRTGEVVVTGDVTRDQRWPRLAAAAGAQRLRSVLALPIRVGDERTGVVNLHADGVDVFAEPSVRVGEVVGSAVAAVLREVGERASLRALVNHLQRALDSRAVIEQAKGIVMAHHGGTADEAFARLIGYSSRTNVKLRALADRIVREGGTSPLRGL